jgi:hypothetical protein
MILGSLELALAVNGNVVVLEPLAILLSCAWRGVNRTSRLQLNIIDSGYCFSHFLFSSTNSDGCFSSLLFLNQLWDSRTHISHCRHRLHFGFGNELLPWLACDND